MNSQPPKSPRRYRHARVTLILMALSIPLILFGALKALQSTSNDPRQWLPRTFAETDTYDWFQEQFGSDELAVVSWPGCVIDDPRVPQLAEALAASEYFDRALTGQAVLQQLMALPQGMDQAAAVRRLQGILIGAEDNTTCLLLTTSEIGKEDRSEAVREIEHLALTVCQLESSELRMAGPTVDAAAIDAESRRLLFQLAGLSALVSFLMASLRLGSVVMAIVVMAVATYSTGLSLAILYYSGGQMNLLMTMLPPLVFVLSISSAVHLANYYRDAVASDPSSAATAPQQAVSHGWMPCLLAAGTTSVGLASLFTSKIDPIRLFGIYSAIGVIASVAVLFLMLPAALHLFPPKRLLKSVTSAGRPSRYRPVVAMISRHHLLFTGICLALMVVCGARIPFVQSTVRLQDRFLPQSDAITDYQWLEQHIGPMVPLEVVVHFDKDDPRDLLEQMKLVAAVQGKIQNLDQPAATLSAVNLCPRLPSVRGVRGIVARRIINSPQTRQRLIDASFLAETDDEQLWRITVRANAIGNLDYGHFAETIEQSVGPLLQEQGVRGTYTGVIPLIYKAQRQLLQDLFRSFLVAFVVIAAVLMVVLRSFVATLLAMIPNVFPAVIVFGGLEWASIPVQIGSVMTASAALGIAVDDTVHVLTWFRRGLDAGLSRLEALNDAFERCAGAMMHTTLICSGGLIVFAASSFVPILHFAWMMVFLLFSALIGDLVLLPAILAGPLGRFFEGSKRVTVDTDDANDGEPG